MAEETGESISGEKLELIQRILELQNTLHGKVTIYMCNRKLYTPKVYIYIYLTSMLTHTPSGIV